MYTTAGILDLHQRTHVSIQGVLDHLATLPEEALHREVEGFSYPTLALQVHHYLAAERYWFGVMRGEIRLDDDETEHTTVDALRALRAEIAERSAEQLGGYTDEELSAPRSMTQWNGTTVDLAPAHVAIRTQVHAYQHHGEIASMLRLLSHGFPSGLDFPIR